MPPWLPAHRALDPPLGRSRRSSSASLVLVPATRRLAAWGIIAAPDRHLPGQPARGAARRPALRRHRRALGVWNWVRLPFQAVLIAVGLVVHLSAGTRASARRRATTPERNAAGRRLLDAALALCQHLATAGPRLRTQLAALEQPVPDCADGRSSRCSRRKVSQRSDPARAQPAERSSASSRRSRKLTTTTVSHDPGRMPRAHRGPSARRRRGASAARASAQADARRRRPRSRGARARRGTRALRPVPAATSSDTARRQQRRVLAPGTARAARRGRRGRRVPVRSPPSARDRRAPSARAS